MGGEGALGTQCGFPTVLILGSLRATDDSGSGCEQREVTIAEAHSKRKTKLKLGLAHSGVCRRALRLFADRIALTCITTRPASIQNRARMLYHAGIICALCCVPSSSSPAPHSPKCRLHSLSSPFWLCPPASRAPSQSVLNLLQAPSSLSTGRLQPQSSSSAPRQHPFGATSRSKPLAASLSISSNSLPPASAS